MDTRTETLDALSKYIEAQRALLARTNEDIERLKRLRSEAMAEPRNFVDEDGAINLSYKLTDLAECAPSVPKNIDWSLYASLDPTPLRTLVHDITLSRSLSHPKHPPKSQHAPLSSLQRLVKDARSSILEPLGLGLGADVGSTAPSEIGIDFDDSAGGPMITGPDGTGADVRGGKKRGGLRVVIPAHPQLRARGANGAFLTATATPTSTGRNSPTAIRNGSTYSRPKRTGISSTVGSPATTTAFLVPSPTTPFYPPPTPERPGLGLSMAALPRVMPKPKPKSKALRPRKGAVVSSTPSTTSRTRGRHAAAEPMEVDNSDTTCAPARAPVVQITPSIKIMLGKRTRAASPSPPPTAEMPLPAHVGGSAGKGNGKKKPETYKQAWSVSEQHLLEKLLDEIPEGSKNRWQKISLAMEGRRTPRQVASRVQKYFEKLKRYGVGVDLGEAEGG